MANSWANLGVDLHVDLTGTRVRAGLEQALREAVQTGRLRPGLRLPPSRSLAADLGIARNTVAEAYSQLVAEGWFMARQGSGTYVAERAAPLPVPPAPLAGKEKRIRYDLRAGYPDLSAFPRSGWLTAMRRALSVAPSDAMGYPDPRGRPELRQALADYLARARGVRVTPERVIVCSGFSQGLALLCRVLAEGGATTLATEAFGLQHHRAIAATNGLAVRALPVDAEGAQVDGIVEADAVLLTPAHQFPLGMPLAAKRRTQVIKAAIDGGAIVIEDDYDGEFRYDRQAIGAMQALAPEHVVYAGTASKTLAPGLRLGWLVAPAHMVEPLATAKATADQMTGTMDQLALAEFITSGNYDRHVRRARVAYRRRRDRLVAALTRQVPQVRVTGVAAGLHALVELPELWAEPEIVAGAAGHGVAVSGLEPHSAGVQAHGPALVVGYATPPEHAFSGAVARLCAALSEFGD